ncbi:MYH9s [Mytilus edulis]|uniref:MYH9s n=1 Tax=Mytilus edulis TaxID=6550 RepID=A0A8S3SFA5_MYTED|nr:MYH9s [Mytilus edulis]
MANLSLDEKEISSMKKDILDMKQQRKKFENDIRLLYAGHYDQNDNLDTLETVLQNITVTFNERINNLTTELNTLNTKYERQVRLQKEMQKQIDAMGTENRKKFEEFNQKMIVMKQNLNDMTASQEVLKNDLRDAQSSMRRETQNAVDRIRNDFRAAQHKLESDYRETRNSQNELKASQQSLRSMLLGKHSSEKFLNEDSADMVVDLTSHDEEKTKHSSKVHVLYISSMKKDILQIKVQRKKFEHDITLLFFGHGRQNKDLDKAETMLKNNTVIFDEFTKKRSNFTTNYGQQIKLHLKMQYKIDNIETEDSKTFGELEQKQMNLKQNLNNMTKAQDILRNDLRETRSKLQKDMERTVQSLRIEFEAARSKLEANSRAIKDSQNELRENHQNLLETSKNSVTSDERKKRSNALL